MRKAMPSQDEGRATASIAMMASMQTSADRASSGCLDSTQSSKHKVHHLTKVMTTCEVDSAWSRLQKRLVQPIHVSESLGKS